MKRLSELLGSTVRTEAGRKLGRVHDVRAELRPRTAVVTGLIVGRVGLLERLGIGSPESRGRTRRNHVPWRSVVLAGKRGVVVRDDVRP